MKSFPKLWYKNLSGQTGKKARSRQTAQLKSALFLYGDSNDKLSASRSLGRLSSQGCRSTILYWTGPLRRPRCTSQRLDFDESIAAISMGGPVQYKIVDQQLKSVIAY